MCPSSVADIVDSGSLSLTNGDRKRKPRTHCDLALHPDLAAWELDELPTQGQAERIARYPASDNHHVVLILRGTHQVTSRLHIKSGLPPAPASTSSPCRDTSSSPVVRC